MDYCSIMQPMSAEEIKVQRYGWIFLGVGCVVLLTQLLRLAFGKQPEYGVLAVGCLFMALPLLEWWSDRVGSSNSQPPEVLEVRRRWIKIGGTTLLCLGMAMVYLWLALLRNHMHDWFMCALWLIGSAYRPVKLWIRPSV